MQDPHISSRHTHPPVSSALGLDQRQDRRTNRGRPEGSSQACSELSIVIGLLKDLFETAMPDLVPSASRLGFSL